MSTMQKNKGKAFEEKTAKFIHEYLYKNIEDYKKLYDSIGNVNLKPRREKSSGTAKDADNDIDLGIAYKFFPYSIECKHHKVITDVTINALLDKKFSWLETVMKQANTHATIKKLSPLIVFRGNRTIDFCCLRIKDKPEIVNLVYNNNIDFIIYNGFIISPFDSVIKFLVIH